jgi:PAS domain S-box-containing protein
MDTNRFVVSIQAIAVIFLIEVFTCLGGQLNKSVNHSNCNFNSFPVSYSVVLVSGLVTLFLVIIWSWFQSYQKYILEGSQELEPRLSILNYSQALQESEARFRNAFDHAAVGMALVAIDGRWLKVNQTLCEITGYSESELLETSWQKITYLDDLSRDFDYINQLVKGEIRSYQIEKRYIHNQGHIIWISLNKSLVRNCQGEPLYFITQIQDITESKKLKSELAEKQELIDAFITSSPVGITVLDNQFRFSLINEALAEINGISVTEHIGKTPWEIVPDLADKQVTFFQQILAKCEPILDVEISGETKKLPGVKRTWLVSYFPICTQEKQPIGIGIIVIEITDRKAAEAALKESEARFQAFMNNNPFLAWITTQKGKVVYSNQNLAQWFKQGLEQVIGKNITELYPESIAKAHLKNISQVVNTGEVLKSNELSYRPDGSLAELLVYNFPLIETSEQCLVGGVAVDITEQKQAVTAMKLQYEQERLLDIIVQHIRQSLNLKEILQTTVTEIQNFLACDRVVISRINWSNFDTEVIVESRYANCQSILGSRISNNKNSSHPIIDRHHQNFLKSEELKELKYFDVQAQLTIPIWQGKSIWGWLIAHSCHTKRQWQQQEISLLQRLKNQLEVAIYQSELHHQLQQLNADLERQVQARTLEFEQALTFEATLKSITDKVRDSFDEQQILQQVVEELAKALELNCCETTLYIKDTTCITRYESTNAGTSIQQIKGINTIKEPAFYQQLLYGEHFAFCHLICTDEAKYYAILACPIVDDQGVLGDIRLFKPELSSYSGLEIRLVQQVANQCAIALRQSRLYQAAQKQVAELEKLNQLKDDFLSTISHELRTPVSNIKMAVQMLGIILGEKGNHLNKALEINRYLQMIRDESQREMDLINDLLILTQISAETEPLFLNTIQLQALIPHITEIFTATIDQQQQQLKIYIPDNLPALTTDVNFLERIFVELLNNACKYTPPGETITITAKATKDKLQISISNTGIEIPQVEKERVFDKFYRIPSNDPWKQGGTGLGLALVKKLVEHLGGTIELITNQGELKTSFLLSFPLLSKVGTIPELSLYSGLAHKY